MRKKYKPGDMIRVNLKTIPEYVIIISNEGKILNAYDSYMVFDLATKEMYVRPFMNTKRGAYTKVA